MKKLTKGENNGIERKPSALLRGSKYIGSGCSG